MKYELKQIGLNELEEVSKIAWGLYQNPKTSGYPRYVKKPEQMYKHLKELIDYPGDEVVACYDGEKIVGIFGCSKEIKENYAQTTAYYVDKDFDVISDMFIDYIKNKHKGFELLMGFPAENKSAVDYCNKKGYECIESSYRYEQDPKLLNYVEADSDIMTVGADLKEEYLAFHKKHGEDMYWNSDRVRENFDRFLFCVYNPNNEIKASVMFRNPKVKEPEIQAFFNEDVDDEGKLKQLLSYSIKQSLDEKSDNVVYFIDEDCELERRVALGIGFKEIEHYMCFKVNC